MSMKKISVAAVAFILGIGTGYFLFTRLLPATLRNAPGITQIINPISQSRQVIGFLPYWLTDKADKNYTRYITDLTYFGLTIDADGSIKKFTNPGESEPGWYALKSGKIASFLSAAKKDGKRLSLAAFSGDEETIYGLIEHPVQSARTLVDQFEPVMKQHGFTSLNLDIESVSIASDEARGNFTAFVKEVKSRMDTKHLGTLSIDVSPTALFKKYLVDVKEISPYVDAVIFMTYDYHYPGSSVTGPVAPLSGAGLESEFDTEAAIRYALTILPPHKIIAGVPLYGYEWETLGDTPRSAVIPGTGLAASNRRVESLLSACSSCSARIDDVAEESYVIYHDEATNTYHQFFYPDQNATKKKVQFAEKYKLNGLALWALGYDGGTILLPLETYIASP